MRRGKHLLTYPESHIHEPLMPGRGETPAPPDLLRAGTLPEEIAQDGAAPVPAFADGTFSHLHPNYIKVDRIGWIVMTAFVAAGAVVGFVIFLAAMGPGHFVPWLVLAGGAALIILSLLGCIMIPQRAWKATTYAVSELGLEIRRGIWWKHVIDVPRSRIQHTDVAQGPLARYMGLGKLIVYTAGTEHASVELDGLEHGRAIQMRDFLLRGGEDDAV